MHQGNLDLTLDQITKIEGHACVDLKIREGNVEHLKFSIAEFKRFYTKAVEGKVIQAIPSLVSRICGTCSNAHLLCSLAAIEDSQGIEISDQTRKLRELLNHGLIIRDHALHLYIFSLPDIYQKDSLLDFDEGNKEEHELLHDALAVKEAGNKLSIWSGGRSVHAPNLVVGGFSKLPEEEGKKALIQALDDIRPRVLKLINIFYNCSFTHEEKNFTFSALRGDGYAYLSGSIVGVNQNAVSARNYSKYLTHVVIPYSQAAGYTFKGKVFMVGALSRVNLHKEALNARTKQDIQSVLSVFPSKNIFHNNLAQAIEILNSIDTAHDILSSLSIKKEKPVSVPVKEGVGVGVIEAPRGTLYHRYHINSKGVATKARIIVPTGQNQIAIEKALAHLLDSHPEWLNKKSKDRISFEFEKLIRAFDPCMSCASHFLKLKIQKES